MRVHLSISSGSIYFFISAGCASNLLESMLWSEAYGIYQFEAREEPMPGRM
jgi:hypothetical protein